MKSSGKVSKNGFFLKETMLQFQLNNISVASGTSGVF